MSMNRYPMQLRYRIVNQYGKSTRLHKNQELIVYMLLHTCFINQLCLYWFYCSLLLHWYLLSLYLLSHQCSFKAGNSKRTNQKVIRWIQVYGVKWNSMSNIIHIVRDNVKFVLMLIHLTRDLVDYYFIYCYLSQHYSPVWLLLIADIKVLKNVVWLY